MPGWTKYFRLKGIRPGVVITHRHGRIDFSSENIPLEVLQDLYEHDFSYLDITAEGKKKLYGIGGGEQTAEETPARNAPMEFIMVDDVLKMIQEATTVEEATAAAQKRPDSARVKKGLEEKIQLFSSG